MTPPANQSATTSPKEAPHSGPGYFGVVFAFASRELRTLTGNRFLHVFAALAILGGSAATRLTPSIEAIPFILLQGILYVVPLFAVLIGLSSAHGELEEHPFLFSQPFARSALVLGKAVALGVALGAALLIAFIPAFIFSPRTYALVILWGASLLLTGVFVSLGLAIGLSLRDRSRGILYALLAWLLLLIGFDLFAYGAAMIPFVQQQPLIWLAGLLMNPVDAVRIAMLFNLEEIPFSVSTDHRWVNLWLDNILPWATGLCALWIALLLLWGKRQVDRREI